MEKNTILYVGGFKLPDKNAAAHRVMSNAKILNELGYKVVFLGQTEESISKDILQTKKKMLINEYYQIKYPSKVIEYFYWFVSIKNLKLIVNTIGLSNTKCIVAYNYPAIALFWLIIFSKINKIKIVGDITEWYIGDEGSPIIRIIKRIDNYLRLKLLNRHCDSLILISKKLMKLYCSFPSKILLPPLVDLSETKWLTSIHITSEEFRLIYVGNPALKEKLLILIYALNDLSKCFKLKFTIIGVSYNDLLKKDKSAKKIFDENPNTFEIIQKLSNVESIKKIADSHYFIFFRRNTIATEAGFPTKFVESISAGTPVITNRTSNIDDYLIFGKNGYFINNFEELSSLKNDLFEIFSKGIDHSYEMKKYCKNSKIFDIKNYINVMIPIFQDNNLND